MKNFTKLSDGVFNLKNLKPNEMIILSMIISFGTTNNSIYFSDKYISEKTNGVYSKQMVSRIIRKLNKLNYIDTVTVGNKNGDNNNGWGGKTRTITINPDTLKIIDGAEITIKSKNKVEMNPQRIKELFEAKEAKSATVTTPKEDKVETPAEPIEVTETKSEPVTETPKEEQHDIKDIISSVIDDKDKADKIGRYLKQENYFKPASIGETVELLINCKKRIKKLNNCSSTDEEIEIIIDNLKNLKTVKPVKADEIKVIELEPVKEINPIKKEDADAFIKSLGLQNMKTTYNNNPINHFN